MFIFIILIILFLCVAFTFFTFKILEIEKDLNILYDNYATQLEKLLKLNLERGR